MPDLTPTTADLLTWLSTPMLGEATATPLGVLGGLFWALLAVFSWWWIGHSTRSFDVEGQPIALRLSVLGLRLLATTLCIVLALDLARIVDGDALLKGALGLLNARIFEIGGTNVTVTGIVVLIAVVIATFWGTSVLYQVVNHALHERGVKTSGTVGVLLNLGRYVVLLVGIAVALTMAGINLSALFTVGAVFAVTIGFALQNIAQNFVSGVILLVEGAIQPGDVLEVEGRVVRVVRIGIRSTVVHTLDDEDLIVPNGTLAQGVVKNLTMRDNTLRIRAQVSVSYESDLDAILVILDRAARTLPGRVPHREPIVLLTAFASSGIDFDVSVWIDDPWMAPRARSALRLAIWRAFRDAGVVIPFPQVDVHFDAGIVPPAAAP